MGSKLELKLVIEKKNQKVVFAEVGKDVVDFLLSLFALPMGSVINLITKDSSVGSLGCMYSSWDQLDDKFLHSTKMKANRLIPAIALSAAETSKFATILSSVSPATITENLYRCNSAITYSSSCGSYFTDVYGSACTHRYYGMCSSSSMTSPIGYKYDGPNVTKEEVKNNGYVKGGFTYAVTDDLSIEPLISSLASILLLNKMGHNNLSQLEHKTVYLDIQAEGLELLKTSLWSKNVLTEVFLAKKKGGLQKEDK